MTIANLRQNMETDVAQAVYQKMRGSGYGVGNIRNAQRLVATEISRGESEIVMLQILEHTIDRVLAEIARRRY